MIIFLIKFDLKHVGQIFNPSNGQNGGIFSSSCFQLFSSSPSDVHFSPSLRVVHNICPKAETCSLPIHKQVVMRNLQKPGEPISAFVSSLDNVPYCSRFVFGGPKTYIPLLKYQYV